MPGERVYASIQRRAGVLNQREKAAVDAPVSVIISGKTAKYCTGLSGYTALASIIDKPIAGQILSYFMLRDDSRIIEINGITEFTVKPLKTELRSTI